MTETITLSAADVLPDRSAVLFHQGIPPSHAVTPEVRALYESAVARFVESARPAAVRGELSADEFAGVYEGERRNEPRAPVGEIHVRADALALFVATMGQETCRLIAEGFARNDFAVASMLDAVASAAADRAASVLAERFLDRVRHAGRSVSDAVVLPYSPGYCGWHITGQRKLFAFLDSRDGAGPGSIGVTLRESCLMEPLKSVSGVLIVGPRDMHGFPDDYPFCSTCDTHACRDRIAAL